MARINGNNVLTVVRTAYLNVAEAYPVGSIYISANSTSPASLFGGTWERISDKFLYGSANDNDLGNTGGSADAVLVKHRHEVVDFNNSRVGNNTSGTYELNLTGYNNVGGANYLITDEKGESGTGKNMPPYIKVAIWKRTA